MPRTGAWRAQLVELMCCMDERDKVQKKTFTKWMNQHLMKVQKHVNDLYEDLRDGHNLISLLEVLSGDTLHREEGQTLFHRLKNVQVVLDYLKNHQVKLVNIRNDDITDGNPKLTLGLIWTIIFHFQLSDIHVTGESEEMSAKERLLLWSQQTTEGYAGIRCENFTTCWRDGRLFNAIIHKYRPDLIDMNTVAIQSNRANLERAFFVAEKLGVAQLLDPEDVDVSLPDEKSIITYVSSLYDAFLEAKEDGEGNSANLQEKQQAEQQYLQQLKDLSKQIQRVTDKAEETMLEAVDLKKIKMKYEEELKTLHQEKAQLKREVEELTVSQTKTEITIKHLNSKISCLQKEKLEAERRTELCKEEETNLHDQYKKIQEELLQKTKVEKENQQEIQMLRYELAKSNQKSETLKKKIEGLMKWNTETKLIMTEKMTLEKQSIQEENDTLKGLADGFKEQLRKTNEQLHKQTIMEQKFICKIKTLEADLAKAKDLVSEYKQKCDKQSASPLTTDQEVKNLTIKINSLTVEKGVSEQKAKLQDAHIQELSNKLKKLQDELHQKSLDEQMACKKMILFQEESIKCKNSAEEFRKKVEKLLESHSVTEKEIFDAKLQCIALQQEKHMAEENMMLYKMQVEDLQERLEKCHEQLQQGKQAEMDYQHRCRKLEEELAVQKRMVESLKQKMDLQVKDDQHRVFLLQNEVQQNNRLEDSEFKLSCERGRNDFSYLSVTTREFEQLPQRAQPSSPLLRHKQERL